MICPFDKKKYPNLNLGHEYALDVVAGNIPASIYTIGACKRYLREIEFAPFGFEFRPEKAEKYLRLVQKFEHVIGKWNYKYIVLESWQCFIWMNIMGWYNLGTSFRRYRLAHIEVARGNGKSAMASTTALYFLALDDPQGNQVSTVATKKEQARIVLDSSRAMAKKNKSFLKATGIKVQAHDIVHDVSNSKMRALSSEASSLDGLNDILAVCDELHAMNRNTFEVITSGMSKRRDSLTLCITTAGFDVDSVGYSQSEYAKRLLKGEFEDDTFFAIVYCLDEKDDIWLEENWKKANPNWGVSVDPETFRAKMQKARLTPADLPGVKVKHLNMWISEANAFYDLNVWDACADSTLKIEDFHRMKTKMGIDLASHIDLTSWASIFYKDGKYFIFEKTYIPEETLKMERNTLYDNAVGKGYLHSTPGAAINNDYIRKEVLDFAKGHRVGECAYDTWNATEMANNLAGKIEMVKFAMNTANFSEPMKKLDSLMREGKIVHNGSPLLRWCLGNVVAKRDHNDNVFPRKSHVKLKIDPIIAVLMSLGLWLADENKDSVYESRGIRTL